MSLLYAVPALPIVAVASALAARRPVVLIAVYAAVVPFGSSISVPGVPGPFGTLSTIIGLLVALLLLVHLALGRQRVIDLPAPLPLWVLVVVTAAITTAWSIDRVATVFGLLVLASLVGLYVVASLIDVGPEGVHRIGSALVVSGSGIGVFALAQLVTGTMFVDPGTGTPRFVLAGGGGEVGDPNITAAGLLLPLSIALFRTLEVQRTGRDRAGHALAVIAMTVAILLTGSRGGLFGLVAIGAVLFLLVSDRRPRSWHLVLGAVVAVCLFLLAPAELQTRLLDVSSTGRADIWMIGLAACSDYCLQGSGWDTFHHIHARGLLVSPDRTGWVFGFGPHNVWLQILVQTGIAGFVFFMAALVISYRELLRLPSQWRGAPVAALTSLLAANIFLGNFHFKYFWLTLLYVNLCISAAEHLDEGRRHAGLTSGDTELRVSG
jgi:O-antigen ligase